ncbi:MAG: TIGR03546 family protein [Bdellovibrionales bacterium GWA1_52_35]|nr:MAG: TIGR03546 family protein [Bdellovibrionales bacterium GWA1_52_35]HCM40205.1 DUF2062 domain-containing protein [Bdellovibrionales bacterium]
MTILLKQVFAFLKLLNSDKGSNQISAGIACGMILGFTPAFSLQTLLIVLVIFLFRVQLGAALLSAAFFTFPAYWLDPVFHRVGAWVLETQSLTGFFTTLYNLPIIPLTRFNNSVVMGAGVVALALAPLVYVTANILVRQYREKVASRFEKTPFWKAVKATSFYQWYLKYEEFRG